MNSESMRRQETTEMQLASKRRAVLEADISRFLESGGMIQEIETGLTGLTESGLQASKQRDMKISQKRAVKASNRNRK